MVCVEAIGSGIALQIIEVDRLFDEVHALLHDRFPARKLLELFSEGITVGLELFRWLTPLAERLLVRW